MVMAKKSKIDVPESVCLFDKKEIEYINQTAKSIPYRLDLQTATINVPPDHFEIASENLHIRHLMNKFAFVVQATIGAEVIDKSFNPVLRSFRKTVDHEVMRLPVRGEVWIIGKERWYIKNIIKDMYTITLLEDLRGDIKRPLVDIERRVKSGELVLEVR